MTITDRITVLRNGRHVETKDTADTSIPEIIQMMVGSIPIATKKSHPARKEEVVLRVKNLNKASLGLKDINFVLNKQEILGIAGIQGAGRTELATCLFGVNPADSGIIELEGEPIDIQNPRQAIEHGIGYLTEDRRNLGIFWEMSVWQNMSTVMFHMKVKIPRADKAGLDRGRMIRVNIPNSLQPSMRLA